MGSSNGTKRFLSKVGEWWTINTLAFEVSRRLILKFHEGSGRVVVLFIDSSNRLLDTNVTVYFVIKLTKSDVVRKRNRQTVACIKNLSRVTLKEFCV